MARRRPAPPASHDDDPPLEWLTLRFKNPELEKRFQAQWAAKLLPADRWCLLISLLPVALYCVAGFYRQQEVLGFSQQSSAEQSTAEETSGTCSWPGAATAADGSCSEQARFFWTSGLHEITLAGAIASACIRASAFAALCLVPAWHIRNRTAIMVIGLLVDAAVRPLLLSASCVLWQPGNGCWQLLWVVDAVFLFSFLAHRLPCVLGIPLCTVVSAASASLLGSFLPGPTAQHYLRQWLTQWLLPVACLYLLEQRARLAWARQQRQHKQGPQQTEAQSSSTATARGSDRPETDCPGADCDEAEARELAAQPSATAAATAGDTDQAGPAEGAADLAPAIGVAGRVTHSRNPSELIYRSPVQRAAVSVKLESTVGPEATDDRVAGLASSVHSALSHLPGMETFVGGGACVPGCILSLSTVIWAKQQEEAMQIAGAPTKQLPAKLLSPQDSPDQQLRPACSSGMWELQLATSCNSCCWSFADLPTFEAAVSNGSFQASVAESLPVTAPLHYFAATWGKQLQLVIHSERMAESSAGDRLFAGLGNGCVSSSHSFSTKNSSAMHQGQHRGLVRVVLCHGNRALLDCDHELHWVQSKDGPSWNLQLGLPRSSNRQAGVLSLHILSRSHVHEQSAGIDDRSAPTTSRAGVLACASLLLLPTAAATELQQWIQKHRYSQQQVQQLLQDLCVVVEAASSLDGSMAGALQYQPDLEILDDTCPVDDTAAAAMPSDGCFLTHCTLAAAVAGALLHALQDLGLQRCAEWVASCRQQLQFVGTKSTNRQAAMETGPLAGTG